jgi:hypothetical protein
MCWELEADLVSWRYCMTASEVRLYSRGQTVKCGDWIELHLEARFSRRMQATMTKI